VNAARQRLPIDARVVRWVVAWGLAVTLAEALIVARGSALDPGAHAAGWLLLWMAPSWCLTGCLFVAVIVPAEARLGRVGVAAAWLGVSVVAALVYVSISSATWHWLEGSPFAGVATSLGASAWLATPLVSDALLGYHTWTNLFFGGLLATALTFDLRAERTRSLLHAAGRARARAATLVNEAQFEAIRAQVDPRDLVETLREVRTRYARDPVAAEALLDRLVNFLRAAIAGLRQRESTLAAELEVAAALGDLQAERGLPHAWRIGVRPDGLEGIAFPPRALLPLLALGRSDCNPSLEVTGDPPGIVRLVARGLATVPPQVETRLRAQLASATASASVRCTTSDGQVALVVELASNLQKESRHE
jgi:hypothetical protein